MLKAKSNQNAYFRGNQFKKVVSGSAEPDTNKETNVKLAELAMIHRWDPGIPTGEFPFLVAPTFTPK